MRREASSTPAPAPQVRKILTTISADASSLLAAIESLEHFSKISSEVSNRFLSLGDSLAQIRSIEVSNSPTGARDIRISLELSDGLTALLSACLAGEFNSV